MYEMPQEKLMQFPGGVEGTVAQGWVVMSPNCTFVLVRKGYHLPHADTFLSQGARLGDQSAI